MPQMSPAESEQAHSAPRAEQRGQQVPPPAQPDWRSLHQFNKLGEVEESPPRLQPGPIQHSQP
eukprot:6261955-Prorocentrum_lima.AAC.1